MKIEDLLEAGAVVGIPLFVLFGAKGAQAKADRTETITAECKDYQSHQQDGVVYAEQTLDLDREYECVSIRTQMFWYTNQPWTEMRMDVKDGEGNTLYTHQMHENPGQGLHGRESEQINITQQIKGNQIKIECNGASHGYQDFAWQAQVWLREVKQ